MPGEGGGNDTTTPRDAQRPWSIEMKHFLLRPYELPGAWSAPEPSFVRLCDSFGATLAEDILAETDSPDYDTALRDGWAVFSGDRCRRAKSGSVENGRTPEPLRAGEALWVNTGGMIPRGADAVIPAESPDDAEVARRAVEPGRHVLRRGSEWRAGDALIEAGSFVGASELALLLEAGVDRVKVYAPPAAGILSTGSELKDLYCRGEAGPLRVSSNAAYLRSLLMTAGIRHIHAAAAPDDENAIAAKLSELAHRCGFIFTIGGTGGGQRDLTRRAILLAGGRIFEERSCAGGVPPFISGEIDGVPLLGLPGNPLGAMMIAQRVALPVIWRRFHADAWEPQRISALFGGDIPEPQTGELCVSLVRGSAGLTALPVEKGTGCSRLFREAGGVIHLRNQMLRAGEQVIVERFFN